MTSLHIEGAAEEILKGAMTKRACAPSRAACRSSGAAAGRRDTPAVAAALSHRDDPCYLLNLVARAPKTVSVENLGGRS